MKRLMMVILSLTLLSAGTVMAQDSGCWASSGYGQAGDDIDIFRLGVKKEFGSSFYETGFGFLSGYWEGSLNYWAHDEDRITAVGFSPVFAFYFGRPGVRMLPYIEAGIGVAVLSETVINGRDMSSKFQFEDRIGAGIRYDRFDLNVRYMHYSNAGISEPNDGIDILMFTLGMAF